jgi:hypothetical protein
LTKPLPLLSRRRALGLLASLPVLGRAGSALAVPPMPQSAAAALAARPQSVAEVPFPEGATILVAGPDGGRLGRWTQVLTPALLQWLPPGTSVRTATAGAADGVTAANQFDARAAPDGTTVLLAPGDAVLAWLVGDPRAQFDVGNWVPVMAGVAPAVVVGRPGIAALRRGARVRIAAASPAGPDLPALLGIDLLGARAEPVFGLAEDEATQNAFVVDAVDAVFVRGHHVPEQVAALSAAGAIPLFSLGMVDDTGALVRDPAFPDLPHMTELATQLRGQLPSGPLYSAWQAAAAAVRLDFGLVLPQLTPSAMVALWRRAGSQAAGVPEMRALATSLEVRPLGGPSATANAASVTADAAALLELRKWLATRFNWRPS